ncbi:uncharacterized protein si:ch211-191i18.2 [Hypomesus transpacificus]|uniref:uncharacterized protein si:ch211-191i18.2 n=1 Tax=Hypomesus transpacificus TaxID=137520 RepID=UPI001F0737E8|nr:uncharacterized protein si:ch211-191i18.2 [Hypomesus transpacificus]
MARLSLLLCLANALLLLPLCYGEEDQDYDMTTQDYGDYNATFDYSFYSNSSNEELDKFLSDSEEEEDQEPEVVDEEFEVTTITTVAGSRAPKTSSASASLLFSAALTLHLLPRL